MSVYNCDICSFYTDRKNKLVTHINSQKHKENTENKLKKYNTTLIRTKKYAT